MAPEDEVRDGKGTGGPPATALFWKVLDSTFLAAMVGLLAVFLSSFSSDIKDMGKEVGALNTEMQLQKERVANESKDLREQINFWAGDEFGKTCNLFGGTYIFNSKQCTYVRQVEGHKTKSETINFVLPFEPKP